MTSTTTQQPIGSKNLNPSHMSIKRIMREYNELITYHNDIKTVDEIEFIAAPCDDNLFEWHFTIRGVKDSEFEGGLYHGRILLPSTYPFKPPDIMMLTPSGRFECNKKICLSISSYHPNNWQPSWSIRTVLIALMDFFTKPAGGAIGSLDYPITERKRLAKLSNHWSCDLCKKTNTQLMTAWMKKVQEGSSDDEDDDVDAKEEAKEKGKEQAVVDESSKPTANQSENADTLQALSTKAPVAAAATTTTTDSTITSSNNIKKTTNIQSRLTASSSNSTSTSSSSSSSSTIHTLDSTSPSSSTNTSTPSSPSNRPSLDSNNNLRKRIITYDKNENVHTFEDAPPSPLRSEATTQSQPPSSTTSSVDAIPTDPAAPSSPARPQPRDRYSTLIVIVTFLIFLLLLRKIIAHLMRNQFAFSSFHYQDS
jgi:ubiquitin-conjugating enzyme E2 J1